MRSSIKTANGTDELDAKKRVVLCDTLAARRRTSLDLADTEGDDEVRDDGVLRLTAAVRDHDTPAIGLRKLCTVHNSPSAPSQGNCIKGTYAWMDSEIVPIWLTLRRRPLQIGRAHV